MNENILIEVLAEICEEETTEFSKPLPFKPSLRHRYAMKRIFSSFEERPSKTSDKVTRATASQNRPFRLSTRLVILIAVIVCAALLTGFVLVYISKSFHGTVYSDNTQIFAINTDSCPETIEYEYYLPDLPEGFEMVERNQLSFSVQTLYENKVSGQTITLFQSTKNHYKNHYNTEKHELGDIEINGHEGIFIDFSSSEYSRAIIIWDNDDYIFELEGDLHKNELLDLAKSAKVLEN